jgi:hypothetical protein
VKRSIALLLTSPEGEAGNTITRCSSFFFAELVMNKHLGALFMQDLIFPSGIGCEDWTPRRFEEEHRTISFEAGGWTWTLCWVDLPNLYDWVTIDLGLVRPLKPRVVDFGTVGEKPVIVPNETYIVFQKAE